MTEEIIIDGVNVAGCEHYTTMEDCDGIHDLCEQLDDYCSIKKNCYYKQYKRLEQENKELKEEIQFHNKENSNLLAERNAAQIGYDEIREVRERYRSALEEIREKAQHCIKQDVCALCDYSEECAVPDTDGLVYDNNRLLIKLINEVLND